MDRKLMKQIRRFFFFESLFSGAHSLSKVINETEDELDDLLRNTAKWTKNRNIFNYKKNEKRY